MVELVTLKQICNVYTWEEGYFAGVPFNQGLTFCTVLGDKTVAYLEQENSANAAQSCFFAEKVGCKDVDFVGSRNVGYGSGVCPSPKQNCPRDNFVPHTHYAKAGKHHVPAGSACGAPLNGNNPAAVHNAGRRQPSKGEDISIHEGQELRSAFEFSLC